MKNDRDKLFNELVSKKATCVEFAFHGFIRIYEKGEKHCDCESCQRLKKWNENLDKCRTPMEIVNGKLKAKSK
jgi:hypothetical protein